MQQVFSKVADSYDLMNDVMSAGVHRLWKQYFIQKLDPIPGSKLLDVAGGTGDISFRFIDHIRSRTRSSHVVPVTKVTVCDINAEMLSVGRQRADKLGYASSQSLDIDFQVGDAMDLNQFDDNQFDCYTIAFGIRNVVDIERALAEAYRVLKPGGVFTCLEFSKVQNPLLER